MKLTIVGQPTCRPCTVMKNQILDRMDELEEIGATFEYVNLDELDDKDTFIQAHKLTATPTTFITTTSERKEITGYIDIDTLFEIMEEMK